MTSAFIPDYICRAKRGKPAQPACDSGFCRRVWDCMKASWILKFLRVADGSNLKIWFDNRNDLIILDEDRPSTPNMAKITICNPHFDNTQPTTWINQPTFTQWRNLDQLHGQIVQIQFINQLPTSGDPEKLYYVSEDKTLRIWDQFEGGFTIFRRTT